MSVELKKATRWNTIDMENHAGHTTVADLLSSFFAALEERRINYCVLRDGHLFHRLAQQEEIDLLVAKEQLDGLRAISAELGFVSLPSWGHAPHHFFLKYDERADRWLKVDVVTELNYGRPVRALRTTLAKGCLERRRQCGPTYIPAPEDEFVALLLHCVLDKGRFDSNRQQRLQMLIQEVTQPEYLSSLLAAYWLPSMKWSQLAALIAAGDWETILACEDAIVAQLAERDPLGTAVRTVRARMLRKLNRWVGFWQRRVPMVALLAPDGAGKTTLSEGFGASSYFPVHSVYMGLYQNEKSGSKDFRIPGVGLIGRILTQWRRYLSARYHQGRGRLVIFDRYTYDSLLSLPRSLDPLRKLRRWLLAHACPPPDLVIILDAPGEALYARKGEHTPAILEEQRQGYLRLRSQLAQAVVIDASQDSDAVRREAMALIWHKFRGQAVIRGGSQ